LALLGSCLDVVGEMRLGVADAISDAGEGDAATLTFASQRVDRCVERLGRCEFCE
jgi:hypothetical protein